MQTFFIKFAPFFAYFFYLCAKHCVCFAFFILFDPFKSMKSKLFTLLFAMGASSLAWAQPHIASTETTDDFCGSGSITVTVQNGVEPYEYSLDGFVSVQSSPIFKNIAHGAYTVYVRDANGDTDQTPANSVVVKNQLLELLQSEPITTSATCFEKNNGSAYLRVRGGQIYSADVPYSIMLMRNNTTFVSDSIVYKDEAGISTTIELHKLPQGSYVGTIRDKGGCSIGFNFNIASPAALHAEVTNKQDIRCKGDSTGIIQCAIIGGTAPYSIAAYTDATNPESIESSTSSVTGTAVALSNLKAKQYFIKIEDANGCFVWLEEKLNQPTDTLGYQPYANSINCSGQTSGKIFGNATGGTLPYTYQLDGVDVVYNSTNNTGLFENLTKGIYTAKVTDANGCIQFPAELLTISESETLTVDPLTKLPAATVVCKDQKTASVTFTVAGREQVVAPSDTARYYSVRLFDITNQQEIIAPTLKFTNKFHPVLTKNRVEKEPVLDENGVPTFDPEGNPITQNVTYVDTLWTEGCHEITKYEELALKGIDYTDDLKGYDCDDKITVSGLGAGAYSIRFYQGECQFGETMTFTVEVTGSLPVVHINDVANFCDGSKYTIKPTIEATPGTNKYSWTLGGVEIGKAKDLSYTFSDFENGRLLQLTASNQCGTSVSNQVKITVRNRPSAIIETDKDYLCQNQSANLNITFKGTAPFTYQLPNGETFTTLNASVQQQITPTEDTEYSLIALSDAYCEANIETDIENANITVYPEPEYGMVIDVPNPMVSGRYVTITGTEGFVAYYLQLNGQPLTATTSSNVFETNKFAYGESNNNFTMQLVDKNGCTWEVTEARSIESTLFPTIFTPNGDGSNDVLLAGFNITVFDRQGNIMYQGNGGWDGTVNGKPANQGVYLYTVDMLDADGTPFVLKLTLTLER